MGCFLARYDDVSVKPTRKAERASALDPPVGNCAKGVGGWNCLFWPPDGGMDLQFGILDLGFGRGNTGFWRDADGDCVLGVGTRGVFCNARGEVGFLHNSPRWWRNGVAKMDLSGGSSHEETRGIGARA